MSSCLERRQWCLFWTSTEQIQRWARAWVWQYMVTHPWMYQCQAFLFYLRSGRSCYMCHQVATPSRQSSKSFRISAHSTSPHHTALDQLYLLQLRNYRRHLLIKTCDDCVDLIFSFLDRRYHSVSRGGLRICFLSPRPPGQYQFSYGH